jgi:hypothetical protein
MLFAECQYPTNPTSEPSYHRKNWAVYVYLFLFCPNEPPKALQQTRLRLRSLCDSPVPMHQQSPTQVLDMGLVRTSPYPPQAYAFCRLKLQARICHSPLLSQAQTQASGLDLTGQIKEAGAIPGALPRSSPHETSRMEVPAMRHPSSGGQ